MNNDEQNIRVIASPRNWIVGTAVDQLRGVARLPGVDRAVGMPDLHPGRGTPVGAVVVTRDVVYPHLAGNDIGCGMGLWQTGLSSNKIKLDRWVKKIKHLEIPWDGDQSSWLKEHDVLPTPFDSALGTIGGGNHFAELQIVEEVCDETAWKTMGLDAGRLVLLVHSGSRGFGESILRDHIDRFGGAAALAESSDEANEYLQKHDHAVSWARANRALISRRFLNSLNSEGTKVLDLSHNRITKKRVQDDSCWLHRKGASPSDEGFAVIPGSRGALTYLVQPVGDQQANAFSLAHGAGRKWTRTDSRARLEKRYSPDSLRRTELNSRVLCDDKDLLYEEAPQAYKNIDVVVQDLVDEKLIRVTAVFRPLITYKKRATDR